MIENIIVGNGDNTITLNIADNHVTLGSGANRVVEFPGTGHDIITNFGSDDCIDVSNYHVRPSFVHVDGDTVTLREWRDEIETDGPALVCEPSGIANATN